MPCEASQCRGHCRCPTAPHSVLYTARPHSIPQHPESCSILQHPAASCSTLHPDTARPCSIPQHPASQYSSAHSIPQHPACCRIPQHPATCSIPPRRGEGEQLSRATTAKHLSLGSPSPAPPHLLPAAFASREEVKRVIISQGTRRAHGRD